MESSASNEHSKADFSSATPDHSQAAAALASLTNFETKKRVESEAAGSLKDLPQLGASNVVTGEASNENAIADLTSSTELEQNGTNSGKPSITIDLAEIPTISKTSTSSQATTPLEQTMEASGVLGTPSKSSGPDFLTNRLRSAIGQDLVHPKESKNDQGEISRPTTISRTPTKSSAKSSTENQSTNSNKWTDWSTYTQLPSTLRLDKAMQAMNLQKAKENDTTTSQISQTSSMSNYVNAALDVRNWFATDSNIASSSSPQLQPRSPVKAPVKGMPVGSFPKSISKEKNSQDKVSARKSSIENIEEHDLRNSELGKVDDENDKEERFPLHDYMILSTAGKPVFWSKTCKARIERFQKTRKRKRKLYSELEEKRKLGKNVDELEKEIEIREQSFLKEEQDLQNEEDQQEATRVGLLQAIISNYSENDLEKLHSTSKEVLGLSNNGKVCFLLRPPLYLIAISTWNEAEATMKNHLDYLYQAIISLVSSTKLNRLFDRAANFDLKRLLSGTDIILDTLLIRLQDDTIAMRGAIQPLRLSATIRHDASTALLPSHSKNSRPQDALYALLLTRNGIITLARKRKYSIHPMDCHLLVNMVLSTKALKEGGTQSWVPICLPKFASQGFVYAHVSFLDEKDGDDEENFKAKQSNKRPEIGLVLVTGNPDGFDEMSVWRERVVESLRKSQVITTLSKIKSNSKTSSMTYSADDLGLPGLRHFCFKWRSNVQSTSPAIDEPYLPLASENHKRLLYLYGLAYDYIVKSNKSKNSIENQESTPIEVSSEISSLHSTSTQNTQSILSSSTATAPSSSSNTTIIPKSVLTGKIPEVLTGSNKKGEQQSSNQVILQTSNEQIYAWSTKTFELYICTSSHLPRQGLQRMAKDIIRWIKQNEHELFIVSAPVF